MRAKKHGAPAHAHPMRCDKRSRICLTALPSYAAVAIDLGRGEKRRRYEKLVTRSWESIHAQSHAQ